MRDLNLFLPHIFKKLAFFKNHIFIKMKMKHECVWPQNKANFISLIFQKCTVERDLFVRLNNLTVC